MTGSVYITCSTCGAPQRRPATAPRGARLTCCACGSALSDGLLPVDRTASFAAALAALILYPLAISLPVLSLERFGHRTEASVWSGSIGLLVEGELFVGLVVLLCSVLLPLLKLASLLVLSGFGPRLARRHRASTWRLVEWTGRWGMLDVLLIALLVAWLKLGDLVRVTAGPGALAFTVCVLLSLTASALFDRRLLQHRPRS